MGIQTSSKKDVLHDPNRICWARDCVSDCPRVGENLVIVTSLYHTVELDERGHIKNDIYLERLISEEVDLFESFILDVSERVSFVPTMWESVKRDLAANGKRQAIVYKFLLQDLDKGCSHTMDLEKPQLK